MVLTRWHLTDTESNPFEIKILLCERKWRRYCDKKVTRFQQSALMFLMKLWNLDIFRTSSNFKCSQKFSGITTKTKTKNKKTCVRFLVIPNRPTVINYFSELIPATRCERFYLFISTTFVAFHLILILPICSSLTIHVGTLNSQMPNNCVMWIKRNIFNQLKWNG